MTDTEAKIKIATIDLLLKEGNFGLAMQDIAEKSMVSRTVIHYYFRSKENLLKIVSKEIIENIVIPKYKELFRENMLDTKIERYISDSEKLSKQYPYLDVYVISQHHHDANLQTHFESIQNPFKSFMLEIQCAINEKKIMYATPVCFLIDLFSLTTFSYMYLSFFDSKANSLSKEIDSIGLKNRQMRIMNILFCDIDKPCSGRIE